MEETPQALNMNEWYSPKQAAERLTANSGKQVDMSYVRTLAKYGKIRAIKVSERIRLYSKEDVDKYIVEDRGEKSARAMRQQAIGKPKKNKRAA